MQVVYYEIEAFKIAKGYVGLVARYLFRATKQYCLFGHSRLNRNYVIKVLYT